MKCTTQQRGNRCEICYRITFFLYIVIIYVGNLNQKQPTYSLWDTLETGWKFCIPLYVKRKVYNYNRSISRQYRFHLCYAEFVDIYFDIFTSIIYICFLNRINAFVYLSIGNIFPMIKFKIISVILFNHLIHVIGILKE
jgi:hypothetical protein